MKNLKEYTREEANQIGGTFYYNVFGWSTYFTKEETFATPTGKLKEFPRTVKF